MSESLVGRAVASMRQKAGSVIGVPEPEGENGPAAVGVADLIVTFGIVSAARFAHAVPADAAGVATWASRGHERGGEGDGKATEHDEAPPGQAYYTGHDALDLYAGLSVRSLTPAPLFSPPRPPAASQ